MGFRHPVSQIIPPMIVSGDRAGKMRGLGDVGFFHLDPSRCLLVGLHLLR